MWRDINQIVLSSYKRSPVNYHLALNNSKSDLRVQGRQIKRQLLTKYYIGSP
uniref:Uncharacterized protein n=1 Tax=Arion vulgaris TaxID=1028688 RepID=A0A0B6Z5C8_9EUPU